MGTRQRKVIEMEQDHRVQDDHTIFQPLYVIVFSPNAQQGTVHWLIDLMQRRRQEGGAELLVRTTPSAGDKGIIVEVGASPLHLLEGAEQMEITKFDKDGISREFTFSNLDLFLAEGVTMENFLTNSEKQRIILEELENLQSPEKKDLIGYPHIKLYPGQSLLHVCKYWSIITHIFPLHNRNELKQFEKKWYKFPHTDQPLDDIRRYFGESVGFYFAFLGFQTWALIPPAVVGLAQSTFSASFTHTYTFFAAFNLLWVTVFLEGWKRRSNVLAYKWGTLKMVMLPKFHPTFRGKSLGIDPVTGGHIPVYPAYKKYFKVYFISTPIVFLCLFGAVIVMLLYFWVEQLMIEQYGDQSDWISWILIQLPGVVYACLVVVMNRLYNRLASFLTEWENHKTEASYDNFRIVKLVLFEFVNNFLSLMYIAFYMQDLEMLKWQISIMLLAYQVLNHCQEALLPMLLLKHRKYRRRKAAASEQKYSLLLSKSEQAIEELDMIPYEGTYDDYLEVFIQFGYVFLFSSVFPLAALLAVFNNIVEIWADAFKLCKGYQRPQARPAKGIGVWQKAFEVMGLIAVMTNCALLSMSPVIRSLAPELSPIAWVLVAVAAEHVIIAAKMVLAYLIPDVPKWVTVAIQKAQYESLQALKMERKTKKNKVLRRLRSEYNPSKRESGDIVDE